MNGRNYNGAIVKIDAVTDYNTKAHYAEEVHARFGAQMNKDCEFKVNFLTPEEREQKNQQSNSQSSKISDFNQDTWTEI